MARPIALVALALALAGPPLACGEEPGIETLSGTADSATATDTATSAATDTSAPADTAGAADTAAAPDTSVGDTGAPDAVEDIGVIDVLDASDAVEDAIDPCADVKCVAPSCPVEDQVIPVGECCPVCTTPTCGSAEDCTRCVWPSAPTSEAECYCTVCPVALMTTAECAANQAAWELHCAAWAPDPACPIPRCINEPPPVCDAGVCVEDPEACRSSADCVRCNHAAPPATPDECQCPGCGVPTTATWCEEVETAVFAQCQGLLDDCLPPPCPAPPPLTCDVETFRCVLDFGFEPR